MKIPSWKILRSRPLIFVTFSKLAAVSPAASLSKEEIIISKPFSAEFGFISTSTFWSIFAYLAFFSPKKLVMTNWFSSTFSEGGKWAERAARR